jgi:RNA polymerase-binding transcription factor DksA
LSLLEDGQTRRFLRRLIEAKADGRTAELLSVGSIGGDGASEPLIGRLSDAGLVRREVLVSCRKQNRSLFRLPSQDALAIITGSNAICSECGAAIADERAEELVTPTDLAASVLKDSSWMANRLRAMLVEFGIPETDIAVRPASGDGEVYAMANVSSETFLFLLRDGDVNAAHARRALDTEAETRASHIALIATGKIQDEARVRLREHARRRARTGSDIEVMLIEGIESASAELRHAFERVSQRMLAEELCQLDSSLGINFGHMIATRFRLMQRSADPRELRDLAASAAGALTGSLRES